MSQSSQGAEKQLTDIFINYRRADTSGHAGRLERELSSRFPGRIFMDIHTIEVGTDFAEAINSEVGKCGALIVLIGNQWLDITDPKSGKRRLDNPNDFVALEIAEALKQPDTRVIPVLVEGATMPEAETLPASLAGLVRRKAFEISDTRWDYDVQQLVKVLEKICGTPTLGAARTETGDGTIKGSGAGTSAKSRVAKIAIPIAAALIGIVVLAIYLSPVKNSQPQAGIPTSPSQSPVPTASNGPAPSIDHAVVRLARAEAEFLFAFNTARQWEWYLDKSKAGEMEYRWGVYVAGDGAGINDYAVDIIVRKPAKAAMKSGDIKSLLYYAEITALIRKPNANDFIEAADDFIETEVNAQSDGLKLVLKGEGAKAIFGRKPAEVVFTTSTPEQKAESQHTVDVQYHDN
jgi:hypothetical protein